MPLVTEEVSGKGMVSHRTVRASTAHVTVECYSEKRAYGLEVPIQGSPSQGEWLAFEGRARTDSRGRGDSLELRRDGYFHDPQDGSPKAGWTYAELGSCEFVRTPPPDLEAVLRAVIENGNVMLCDWPGCVARGELEALSGPVMALADMVRDQVMATGSSRAALAGVPDIDPDDL